MATSIPWLPGKTQEQPFREAAPSTTPAAAWPPFDFERFYTNDSFFGDPETCYCKIERLRQALHPTDLVFLFKMGRSQDQVIKSMELFAREVMPRVRGLERRKVRAHM